MFKTVRTVLLLASMAFAGGSATFVAPTAAVAQGMEFCPDLGVLVQHVDGGMMVRVVRGGVARNLGLRPGDLIVAVNGEHPDSLSQLHHALFSGGDNEDHDIDVLRGNSHLHAMIFHIEEHVFMRGTGLH